MNIDSGQTLSVSERLKLLNKTQQKTQQQPPQPVRNLQQQDKGVNLWQKTIPQQSNNTKENPTQITNEQISSAPMIKKTVSSTEEEPAQNPKLELPKTTESDSVPKTQEGNKLTNNPFMQRAAKNIGQQKTQIEQQADLNQKKSLVEIKQTDQTIKNKIGQNQNAFTNQFKQIVDQAARNQDSQLVAQKDVRKFEKESDYDTQPQQNIFKSIQKQQEEKKQQEGKMYVSDNTFGKKGLMAFPGMRIPGMGPPPKGLPKKDTTVYTAETEEIEKEQVFKLQTKQNQIETVMARTAPKKNPRQKQNLDLDIDDSKVQNKNQLFAK